MFIFLKKLGIPFPLFIGAVCLGLACKDPNALSGNLGKVKIAVPINNHYGGNHDIH